MFPVRIPIARFTLTALVLSLLAGCATTNTTPAGSQAATPAPTPGTAPVPKSSEPVPAPDESTDETADVVKDTPAETRAAQAVVDQLARQLRIPRESVQILQVTNAEWPNSCLGLPAEDEICAMMITPGYAISVAASGQRYDYRTDESARRIRLASAPLDSPGKPLLTWRDSRSFSTLIVGTQRVAFGRRGRPLLVAPLGIPERAKELEQLLADYAPFQARTPAGEVALAGVGATRATPVEMRTIAEWAKLVSAEAEQGLHERAVDRAIVWRRQGGLAGVCDLVVVGRSGTAIAYGCRGGTERETARIDIPAGEMAQLFTWLDNIETFSWRSDDPALAEGMSITLDFAGEGVEPASEAEREAIMAFVNRVVTRFFTARASS
jgi:hypothetical protein